MTGDGIREQQYKFQRLEVYQLALEYLEKLYIITKSFPAEEKYNLTSQLQRAGTSVVLNIAEGSTGKAMLNNTDSWGLPCGHIWRRWLAWI